MFPNPGCFIILPPDELLVGVARIQTRNLVNQLAATVISGVGICRVVSCAISVISTELGMGYLHQLCASVNDCSNNPPQIQAANMTFGHVPVTASCK